jgi:CubicO group peptidase (beta-lactamase class C family)
MTLRDSGRFGQFILDGARVMDRTIVSDNWLAEATKAQVSIGPAAGYGYQWWTRDDGTFEGHGIYGQTLHIDRSRRLVIVINSAAEQPTNRAAGQARQEFIAAIKSAMDSEKP